MTTPLPGGLVVDEFEQSSVNMSTYIVAFIVCDFNSTSTTVGDTKVRLGLGKNLD